MSLSSSPVTEIVQRPAHSVTTSGIAGTSTKPLHIRSTTPATGNIAAAEDRNSINALKRGTIAEQKPAPEESLAAARAPQREPEPSHRIDEPPPLTTEDWAYVFSGYGEPRSPAAAPVGPIPVVKPSNIPEVIPQSRWIVARSMADLPVIADEIRYWNDQLLRHQNAPEDIYLVISKDIWFRLLEVVKIFSPRYHILEPTEGLLLAQTDKEREKALRAEGERLVKRYRRNIANLPAPPDEPSQSTGSLTTEEWRELLSSKG